MIHIDIRLYIFIFMAKRQYVIFFLDKQRLYPTNERDEESYESSDAGK